MHHSETVQIIHQYSTDIKGNFACSGLKENCTGEILNKAKYFPFGKGINGFTHIKLKPSIKQIISCKSLNFLPQNTTHLTIPLPLVPLIDNQDLPNLQHISIYHSFKYDDIKINIKDILLDKSIDLKSFRFMGDTPSHQIAWVDMNFEFNAYQNLEYVSLPIDSSISCLNYIKNLIQVKYFSFVGEREVVDLLQFVPKSAELLYLPCNDYEKNFEYIDKFKKLKYLSISNLKSDFNCQLLCELNDLKELELLSCRKISNQLALLKISSLENLKIIDCNKPLTSKEKSIFKNHSFKNLDIDNA